MEPFIGQIQAFAFNYAPENWALCNGQLLSIQDNNALFALIYDTYGGDARTNFALPDLRGRVIVGQGYGPNLTPKMIGWKGGTEYGNIQTQNIPPHHHTGNLSGTSVTIMAHSALGTSPTPDARGGNVVLSGSTGGSLYGSTAPDTALNVGGGEVNGSYTTDQTGNGQPFPILQPECVINFSIALQGIFPPRS